MKRHLLFVFSVFIIFVAFCDDLVTLGGSEFKNIKVTSVDAFGIKILHKTGVEYIPFAQMTDADKAKYGYDPKKERVTLAESQKQKEVIKRKVKEDEMRANSFHFKGKSLQILDSGALFKGELWTRSKWLEWRKALALSEEAAAVIDEQGKLLAMLRGSGLRTLEEQKKALNREIEAADAALKAHEHIGKLMEASRPEEGTYFIAGGTGTLADEERWEGDVIYAGLFKYVDTQGAQKTIRSFATRPELAIKMLSNSDETLQKEKLSAK